MWTQQGGSKTHELGLCPACTEPKLNGVHGGKNAGRACWVVAGTFCGGAKQGTFANKLMSCSKCDFYKSVQNDEGSAYQKSGDLLQKLR